jgi:hypothetical protein
LPPPFLARTPKPLISVSQRTASAPPAAVMLSTARFVILPCTLSSGYHRGITEMRITGDTVGLLRRESKVMYGFR